MLRKSDCHFFKWRAWLAAHHQEKEEIWLVLQIGGSGKRGLTMTPAGMALLPPEVIRLWEKENQ